MCTKVNKFVFGLTLSLILFFPSVDIPNFKEVILMAIVCDLCGYRDNEVKSVAGIANKGKRYKLRLEKVEDLSRDLLVSDNGGINIRDIELEAETGTLGGRFTTVEGILIAIRDQVKLLFLPSYCF